MLPLIRRPFCCCFPVVVGVLAIADFPALTGVHSCASVPSFAVVASVADIHTVAGIAAVFPTVAGVPAIVDVPAVSDTPFAAVSLKFLKSHCCQQPRCCYHILLLHGLPAVAGFYTFTSATSDAGVTAVAGTIGLSGITGGCCCCLWRL